MQLTAKCRTTGAPRSRAVNAFTAFAVLAVGAVRASGDSTPLRNAGFEITEQGTTCQAIPGWTLYGLPTSAICVVPDSDGPALRISKGKAFCYGIPIDPATDYVLTVRVRANHANPRIEMEPPLPGGLQAEASEPAFDWRTMEFPFPATERPAGVRECWIALGAAVKETGGAVWFDRVALEPVGGGPNVVINPSFAEPVVETTVPAAWSMDSGGANVACDLEAAKQGSSSLKVTGVGRPVRISQPLDLSEFSTRGVRRIRVSAWGKSRGLGSDRVRLEIYGATPPASPVLSMSGDAEWMKGEMILDVGRQQGKKLAIWVNAPKPFHGDAWFDEIRIEPVPDSEVINLLCNSSFLPSAANAKLPDYWGLWGDAAWCIEPWSLDYFSIADVTGPVQGTRVLEVHHPATGGFVPLLGSKKLNMFVLTGSGLDLPPGEYTFSIYAKADQPNTTVHIRHPASAAPFATARIGRAWQRITATSSDMTKLPAIHIPHPGSRVWLAAPQLEPGRMATTFRPSLGERNTAPPGKTPHLHSDARPREAYEAADAVRLLPSRLVVYAEYDHVLSDEVVRVRVEWAGPTPVTIHCRILDAVTGVKLPIEQQALRLDKPGVETFAIPTAGLAPGLIGVQAVADVAGKRTDRATDVFAKLAAASQDVRVNRFTRSITVNSTPILPVFLPVDPSTLGDWHMDRLVSAGFNCVVAAPGKFLLRDVAEGPLLPAKETEIRGHLDRLQARGLKILWPLPWSFDDWASTGKLYAGDINGLAAAYLRIISAFRDHPAIIGWYLMDEPSPRTWEDEFGFSEADLRLLWFAVKQADQARPAYVNWNHTWSIEPYGGLQCTDVVSHDNYSTSGESFDYDGLMPSVRMINDFRAGRKPAFAWISGSYDEVALRPSVAAVRIHTWLHLIYGTRGLGYWSKPPLDPLVWAEMQATNRDARILHEQVLGQPDAQLVVGPTQAGTVHYAVWRIGDIAYLLAVNTADFRSPLDVDVGTACGCGVSSGRMLFGNAPLALEQGRVRHTLDAFSRAAFQLDLAGSANRPNP